MAERPVKDYDKFVLRLPEGMRDAIAERAKANGRSMNSEIVQILEDALSAGGNWVPGLPEEVLNPDAKLFIASFINGKFERIEGTLKELLEKVESDKKPT